MTWFAHVNPMSLPPEALVMTEHASHCSLEEGKEGKGEGGQQGAGSRDLT